MISREERDQEEEVNEVHPAVVRCFAARGISTERTVQMIGDAGPE